MVTARAKLCVSACIWLVATCGATSSMTLTAKPHSPNYTMLLCTIEKANCCRDAKYLVFKKNTEEVCSLSSCNDGMDVPPALMDYYKCGCSKLDRNITRLDIMQLRSDDFTSWSCECDGNNTCHSNILQVTNKTITGDGKLKITDTTGCSSWPWILAGCSVTLALVVICVIVVVRKMALKKFSANSQNCLTRLYFGDAIPGSRKYRARSISVVHEPLVLSNSATIPTLEWCRCGNCLPMEDGDSQTCCGTQCITDDTAFFNKFLNKRNLDKTKLPGYTPSTEHKISTNHRRRRVAYKLFKEWKKEQGVTVDIIPACVVGKIRNYFPDGNG